VPALATPVVRSSYRGVCIVCDVQVGTPSGNTIVQLHGPHRARTPSPTAVLSLLAPRAAHLWQVQFGSELREPHMAHAADKSDVARSGLVRFGGTETATGACRAGLDPSDFDWCRAALEAVAFDLTR
jgi:hypothetical protein